MRRKLVWFNNERKFVGPLYSGPLYSGHLMTSTVEPSIPDTLGPVQWTSLFRTPWDQYSGPLYSGHLRTSTVEPSIPDTLGPVQWSPLFRTPWDQYSGPLYSGHLGTTTVDPSIWTPWDQKGHLDLSPLLRSPHFRGMQKMDYSKFSLIRQTL